ncbi:hypothetical protein OY671_002515 [Metschnikowia pulcherrima]|nr:hypothetical protein OY671_002515 [Metschnikowia pulcherrima]
MKSLWVLDLILVAVVAAHLFLAPYTKVEESFNIQAIHDILNYGVSPLALEYFDHKTFPGVVPRTFVGSVALAGIVKAIDYVYTISTGTSFVADGPNGQLHVQVLARAVLAAANIAGLLALRSSLGKISAKSRKTASSVFYTFMLLSQFHLIFYASRTLPNFVVLPLVNFGLSKVLIGDLSGLTWLAFSGAVFRLEVGVFATIIALVSSLVFGQSNLFQGVFMLAVGTIVGLTLTYTVDSYFWGTTSLPEVQAFVFNVVQGKSVEWGVEPYSAYFTKYIINFFRPPHVLVLAVFGLLRDPAGTGPLNPEKKVVTHPARNSLRILGVSALLFVSVMSFQPHKEWRFIIYVAPVFTLLAGHGFAYLWYKNAASYAHRLLVLLVIGSTFVSLAISSFMAFASSYNYPGGGAIQYVNKLVSQAPSNKNITIHMDVPACMTGITHFTEFHRPNLIFDKTESEHALAKIWNNVDYLITQKDMSQPLASDLIVYDASHWDHLASIPAFAGINVRGAVQTVQLIVKSEEFRTHFVSSVLSDLQQGQFKTLAAVIKNSVVLKKYLHVYKRTAPDVMPTILDSSAEDDRAQVEEALKKEFEDQLRNQIDPEEFRESVNEQIDSIEDRAQAKRVVDEL